MRSVTSILLPGGLVVAAGVLLLRPEILPGIVQPYVQVYPYLVFGVGILLGWYFHRTRVLLSLLTLAIAAMALRAAGAEDVSSDSVGRLVFGAVAVLVPLNLALYGMFKERGVFSAYGVARLAFIALQVAAVGAAIRFELSGTREVVESAILEAHLTAWTALPQVALAGFGLALLSLAGRSVARRDPIEAGIFWALVAAFVALHGIKWGWAPTLFLATGGLALIWSLLETTYRMAYYDELTGLPGRRALNEALLQVGSRYAVAMVDVDHFKRFNDLFGHEVGDQALRMVATKLSGITGGGKAFRYGGEEFAVLFPRASAAEAVPHLEAARRAVAASAFVVRGSGRPRKKPATPKLSGGPRVAVSLTISIGVAEPNERKGHNDPHQVLRAADKAVYRAKSAGRNRLMV
jgi:diguanylate cyclase (GGDEF)-like protein